MKVLIISQTFWPDTASVSQQMTDVAQDLTRRGHEINVLSSRYDYENNKIKYPAQADHKGVRIDRINNTGFGKKMVIGRICDFFTFNFLLFFRLLGIRRRQYDLILCTTSPPLVAYIAVIASRRKKIPFCYWTMDLQPELSIVSGLIKKGSLSANTLTRMGNYIIRSSDSIIALDKYMMDYLLRRGALEKSIYTVPIWPAMEKTYTGKRMENSFRRENGFSDRIVVMYSGNHSYVHPLDTLLQAAYNLRNEEKFLFVFIGGGVRKKDVTLFKEKFKLENILQLPYQPRENIHNSLGSADLQVVIMGDGQVGYTHPNKIYGAMFVGKPVLYIGPSPSHITDILKELGGNIQLMHGETDSLTRQLSQFGKLNEDERTAIGELNRRYAHEYFYPDTLKTQMSEILEKEGQERRV